MLIKVFVKKSAEKLKVDEWFRIDREVINKSKDENRRKCDEEGIECEALWKRLEASNKIADENPDQYPRLIETYIFENSMDSIWDSSWDDSSVEYYWDSSYEYKTELEMRDMCEDVGDGMCDEVICDLELQMRIAGGELVDDLVKKADKLPRVRVIKLRNGGTGHFCGGTADNIHNPPADIHRYGFNPTNGYYGYTPYAFRRVLS